VRAFAHLRELLLDKRAQAAKHGEGRNADSIVGALMPKCSANAVVKSALVIEPNPGMVASNGVAASVA
jgi:hypothetical protein